MSRIRCFLLSPVNLAEETLRRYVSSYKSPSDGLAQKDRTEWECPAAPGRCHDATAVLAPEVPYVSRWMGEAAPNQLDPADPRWPAACACGRPFGPDDARQHELHRLWEVAAPADHDLAGRRFTSRAFPPGAMWHPVWLEDAGFPKGPDGRILCVQTPGGEWCVDSRASNCTRPEDDQHRCWVREGAPPLVTAGKTGNTCAAGAGSILCGGYHGSLRNGWLEQC